MREISCELITMTIKDLCIKGNSHLPVDLEKRIDESFQAEDYPLARDTLQVLIDNALLGKQKGMPICQDTGMVTVYITIGQDVRVVDGSLEQAIHSGVRQGYEEGYLRKSIVSDPVFDRINTKDNTPAVIHYTIVEGEEFKIQVVPKGFGSENMSQVKMCKPSDGIEGIQAFVYDVVRSAGPNACPPMVIGVGIGGTFDKVTQLAKKAMIRTIGTNHPDSRYASLEKEWLEAINNMGIGPAGYGGKTTALSLNIETFPTHIAGMPVAVSICCHVARHQEASL